MVKKYRKYIEIILAFILYGLAYNLFIVPNNYVLGDISGLAIIVDELFHINVNVFITLSLGIILMISILFIPKKYLLKTIISVLLYPLSIYITSFIHLNLDLSPSLIMIYTIVIYGFSCGLLLKNGFSTGGSDTIGILLSKYSNKKFYQISFYLDAFIVLLSSFIYGINNFCIILIILYGSQLIINNIIIGISNHKLFYITTNKSEEILKFLNNKLSNGTTIIKTNGHRKIILAVVKSDDFYKVLRGIETIDENVIVSVSDAYENTGGYFN